MARLKNKWIGDGVVSSEKIDSTQVYEMDGLIIDSTNAVGTIGIGTFDPQDPLHIRSLSTDVGLRLDLDDGGNGRSYRLLSDSAGLFKIDDLDAATTRLTISDNGTVTIAGDSTVSGNFAVAGTTTIISTETTITDQLEINQTQNQSALIASQDTGGTSATVVRIENAGNGHALTVDAGNIGIGTTDPQELLHVEGNIVGIDSTSNLGSTSRRFANLYMASGINYESDLIFTASAGGNIGIGTTPEAKFHVLAASASDAAIITGSTTSAGDATHQIWRYNDGWNLSLTQDVIAGNVVFRFAADADSVHYPERLTIYKDGISTGGILGVSGVSTLSQGIAAGVGIGTTDPTDANLYIYQGATYPLKIATGGSSGNSAFRVIYGGTNDNFALRLKQFLPGGSHVHWTFDVRNNTTDYDERLKLAHNAVTIGTVSQEAALYVNGNILGKAAGTSDLGGTSNRFANLYMASAVDYASDLNFNSSGTKVTFTTAGSVGIGTTNPQALFHVNGSLQFESIAGNVGFGTTAPLVLTHMWQDPADTAQPRGITGSGNDTHTALFINGTGNAVDEKIGIQFGNYQTLGFAGIYSLMTNDAGNTVGDLSIDLRSGTSDVLLTERVRFKRLGQVGIGTTDPQAKLHVNGDMQLDQGFIAGSKIGIGVTNAVASFQINLDPGDSSAPLGVQAGSLSDTHTQIFLSGTGNAVNEKVGLQFGGYTGHSVGGFFGEVIGSGGNTVGDITVDMRASTGATNLTETVRFKSTGKLGIGTTDPQELLHVNENIYIEGNLLGLDSTSNLGSASNRFANLYMASGINYESDLIFTASAGGNIGIGTTPEAKVYIQASSVSDAALATGQTSGVGDATHQEWRYSDAFKLSLKQVVTSGNAIWSFDVYNNNILYEDRLIIYKNGISIDGALGVSGVSTLSQGIAAGVGIGTTDPTDANLYIYQGATYPLKIATGESNGNSAFRVAYGGTSSYALELKQVLPGGSNVQWAFDVRNNNIDYDERLKIQHNAVTVGTDSTGASLYVKGDVNITGDFISDSTTLNVPDYVFEPTYDLPALSTVENFISKNKHLSGVPSREDIQSSGLNHNNMVMTLLEKVEELYLYIIDQNKEILKLKKR